MNQKKCLSPVGLEPPTFCSKAEELQTKPHILRFLLVFYVMKCFFVIYVLNFSHSLPFPLFLPLSSLFPLFLPFSSLFPSFSSPPLLPPFLPSSPPLKDYCSPALAQSVEHQTFNLRVQGSSPCSGGI